MTEPIQTPPVPDADAQPAGNLAGLPSEAEPGQLLQELAAAQARAEESRQACLRVAAELDNYRKRAAREVEAARQFGVDRFAADLLAVADSLELGVSAGPGATMATLLEGQQATLRLLQKAFEKSGLTEIEPLGQPFDPAWHEAMAMQPSADHPPNTVLAVVQKGYLLNGRLLRPARVLVSRAPDRA